MPRAISVAALHTDLLIFPTKGMSSSPSRLDVIGGPKAEVNLAIPSSHSSFFWTRNLISCQPSSLEVEGEVTRMTHPLSEKNTLDAHPLPGPSSRRRVHSSAGSWVLSGKMTWPHRPAAWAIACTIFGCRCPLTPCPQHGRPQIKACTDKS